MGNNTSSANNNNNNSGGGSLHRRLPSRSPRTASPSTKSNSQQQQQQLQQHFQQRGPQSTPPPPPAPNQPHKSLRTKKKSLELPDLASLAFTPASPTGSPRGRTNVATSSPIAIPASANGNAARRRPLNNFDSSQRIDSEADAFIEHHVPSGQQQQQQGREERRSRSRRRRERGRQQQRRQDYSPDSDQGRPEENGPREEDGGYVQEVVRSTIPLALSAKPKEEGKSAEVEEEEEEEAGMTNESLLIETKIVWSGGGNTVVLARAGDDDWKGRTVLQRDSPTSSTFSTTVALSPGTHHLRFFVDDVEKLDDVLPTAVDDQGSLANYVAVAIQLFTSSPPPLSASSAPTRLPPLPPLRLPSSSATPRSRALSPEETYWAPTPDASSLNLLGGPPPSPPHPYQAGKWSSTIPAALVSAAREEEAYLATLYSPSGSPAPHNHHHNHHHSHRTRSSIQPPAIPPAPALPRHLEKHILNTRTIQLQQPQSQSQRGSPSPIRGSSPARGGGARSQAQTWTPSKRSQLGITSQVTSGEVTAHVLPIQTASGTDVTKTILQPLVSPSSVLPPLGNLRSYPSSSERMKLGGPGQADDSSMLPVPNHVVLHHLGTSAIKNGVLAVADSTRYRKKFLTTTYYKAAQ